MQESDNTALDVILGAAADSALAAAMESSSSLQSGAADLRDGSELSTETAAQRRRRERIELIEEFGGHAANIKLAALEAIKRGMYSPRTSRGDVELCLIRTWMLRKRNYGR